MSSTDLSEVSVFKRFKCLNDHQSSTLFELSGLILRF